VSLTIWFEVASDRVGVCVKQKKVEGLARYMSGREVIRIGPVLL
jgi:hypothetical protein